MSSAALACSFANCGRTERPVNNVQSTVIHSISAVSVTGTERGAFVFEYSSASYFVTGYAVEQKSKFYSLSETHL